MALVQQGFKLFSLILLLLSCETVKTKSNMVRLTKSKFLNTHFSNDDNNSTSNLYSDDTYLNNSILISDGSISSLFRQSSDLWVGKLGGELLRYNLYTKETTKFSDNIYSIKDFSIKKIIEYNNEILALQSTRVISVDKNSNDVTFIEFPNDISRASDILIYNDNIYISTLGYGLWIYDFNSKIFTKLSQPYDYISSLLLEGTILYVGTMNYGLSGFNIKTNKAVSRLDFPIALFGKNITYLNSRDSIIWVGTGSNGLILWDKKTNSIEKILETESVSSIYLDDSVSIVSFIGYGIYIQQGSYNSIETISSFLKTNNVTAVNFFENYLISGNIKKGLIQQEIFF